MLLATHFLNKKAYQEALAGGVKIFLYNETDFVLPQTEGITFFNCTTQRVPSTWFTWRKNEELLLSFKAKFPQFFQWGSYDMTLAFRKAIYWSNQRTGFLHYTKETFFKNEKVFRQDPLHPAKTWKVLLKYFASKIRTGKNTTDKSKQEHSRNIGIYIRNEFQISLYGKILAEAAKNEQFIVFVSNENLVTGIKENGIEASRIHVCSEKGYSEKIPLVNVLAMNRKDLFVLNQLLIQWQEVADWIGVAEYMISKNIGKLLINEGENGVFGAVMGEVMNKHGVTTYNTMNGMKSGQVQDSFINFDYWFVWDEQMKNLLTEKNKLNPDMLLVSGHLMEDEARNYTYQNSIGINPVLLEGKKVISLFSVRGKREEKIQAFEYLYALADKDPDIVVLVRFHPSEKGEDRIEPQKTLSNIIRVEYNPNNSKTTLYDQLSISSLSICFGSTVALESKWFGVPCITVEKREDSLIYAVDGEMIVKTERLDDTLFDKLLNSSNQEVEVKDTNVAEFIASVLRK